MPDEEEQQQQKKQFYELMQMVKKIYNYYNSQLKTYTCGKKKEKEKEKRKENMVFLIPSLLHYC